VPREIIFTKHLPREDSGKIKKRLLRDAYQKGELI
jgi:acyl-coenzyme A synthetase/AMP-(fatty) acid ligase